MLLVTPGITIYLKYCPLFYIWLISTLPLHHHLQSCFPHFVRLHEQHPLLRAQRGRRPMELSCTPRLSAAFIKNGDHEYRTLSSTINQLVCHLDASSGQRYCPNDDILVEFKTTLSTFYQDPLPFRHPKDLTSKSNWRSIILIA